jgi:hypothetical protein
MRFVFFHSYISTMVWKIKKNDNVEASTYLYMYCPHFGSNPPHDQCKLKLIGGFDDARLLKRVRVYMSVNYSQ